MKCTNCGKTLIEGAQFCQYCGAVQAAQTQVPQTAQPEQIRVPQTAQPEQMQVPQTAQPEQMQVPQSGYPQTAYPQTAYPQTAQMQVPSTMIPPKKSKTPLLIVIILLCVLIAAGGAVGVILGVKGCAKSKESASYDKSTPQKAAQALCNALNNENSREVYKCFSPAMIKLAIYFGLPDGYKGLLLDSNDNPEPEVYDAANSALKLAHKKYDCKVSYKNVTENKLSDSKSTLTGDLYFGNINVGELKADFVKESGSWYISNMDTSHLDYEKLQSIFGKYGSFSNNTGYSSSYDSSDW